MTYFHTKIAGWKQFYTSFVTHLVKFHGFFQGTWIGWTSKPPKWPKADRWGKIPGFFLSLLDDFWMILGCLKLPSGKHTKSYGTSQFLMGKFTISMAIFNSFLYVYSTRGYLHFVRGCWNIHVWKPTEKNDWQILVIDAEDSILRVVMEGHMLPYITRIICILYIYILCYLIVIWVRINTY